MVIITIILKLFMLMSSNDFEKFILDKITGFMIYKQLSKAS